jgi:predicted HTH transcriptional regulator
MALANSNSKQTKYIIIGIKEKPNGQKEIIGIPREEFKDSAEYQQLIFANIEPDLHIDYIPFEYNKKDSGTGFLSLSCISLDCSTCM